MNQTDPLQSLDKLLEQSAILHRESDSILVFDSYMLELGEKLSATYPELRELLKAVRSYCLIPSETDDDKMVSEVNRGYEGVLETYKAYEAKLREFGQ